MRHLGSFFLGLCLVICTFVISDAGTRRYSGTEVQNLVDTINAHSAVLVQTQYNIEAICEKLDADGGVTDTDYESSISAITTAENTLRRNP